jgi:hypothetical protein
MTIVATEHVMTEEMIAMAKRLHGEVESSTDSEDGSGLEEEEEEEETEEA